mgnify:CR=1 FL=1
MKKLLSIGVGLMAATGWCQMASAQKSGLAEMDVGQLRPEVQRRFDEALAATKSPEYLSATDSRFMWASEAKAWCGIALGFLKTSTRDAESLSRCDRFHGMMKIRMMPPVPAVAVPAPPPAIPNAVCENLLAAIVFFDWDSATLPANVDGTLAFATENKKPCSWNRFTIVGHTDRSGADGYNNALSMRRAQAVSAKLEALGVPSSILTVSAKGESEPKVQTADGERNPTNRRVEVTAAN